MVRSFEVPGHPRLSAADRGQYRQAAGIVYTKTSSDSGRQVVGQMAVVLMVLVAAAYFARLLTPYPLQVGGALLLAQPYFP
jgi:hypothetical protein